MYNPRPAPPSDPHNRPGFALLYLAFVFLPLLFWPNRPDSAITASLVATAAFLPVYFAAYRESGRWRSLLPFVMAAIGYALLPFNGGGNTFVIYACVFAARRFPPSRVVAVCALLLALMSVEVFWLYPRIEYALGYVGVVALVGGSAVAGILHARARHQYDAELRLSHAEVRRLAALAERERIGRDLHDLLGHTLSLVALKSDLAGKLLDRDPAAARTQIDEVRDVARQALAEVREAVSGIRASGLQDELDSARAALLAADIRFDQAIAPVTLDAASETVFAFALREAVTNVLRHAGASRVEVELRRADAATVHLSISDDGRGGAGATGNGLDGMRERVSALGGELRIDSPPGGGTQLDLRLPVAA